MILLKGKIGRCADCSVKNRDLPCLFVVKLSETWGNGRNCAYTRYGKRVAEQLAVSDRYSIALEPEHAAAFSSRCGCVGGGGDGGCLHCGGVVLQTVG